MIYEHFGITSEAVATPPASCCRRTERCASPSRPITQRCSCAARSSSTCRRADTRCSTSASTIPTPDDYPDRAAECGHAVVGAARGGRALCGSGAGASIAANKVKGVRAAVCHDSFSARQSREDDDANVICLGERVIGAGLALELIDRFLASTFTGAERHQRRLDKVLALEAAFGAPEGD